MIRPQSDFFKKEIFKVIMKKLNIFIVILFVVTTLLEVFNIFLSNTVTADSIKATQLQVKIAKYDEKNLNLKSTILKNSSYEYISSRSAEFGFRPRGVTVTLNSPLEVAVR